MTSSTVDAAARIAELERQVRDLQHQLAAREGALRELAGRLRSLEPLVPVATPATRPR